MKPHTRVRNALLATVLPGLIFAVDVAPGFASSSVQCGATVTTSIKLSQDLGPCDGDGLDVTANNVTVDLNGHTIRGASLSSEGTPEQTGVRLLDVSGVTVRNGTVRDFYAGIVIHGGSHNTIWSLTATHNLGTGTEANVLGDGLYLDGSSYNTISHNVVTDNGPYAGVDIWYGSLHNTVSHNYIADNNIPITAPGVSTDQLDDGIHAEIGSSYTIVDHNRVLRNGHDGIAPNGHGVSDSTVTHNIVRDNGKSGISASGNGGHFVSHNIVDHNGYDQFYAPGTSPSPGDGIGVCGTCLDRASSPFTTIQDNVVTRNDGPGIELVFNGFQILGGCGIFGCITPQPYHPPRPNLVRRNIVRDNTGDGIFVECDKAYDANFNATCMVPDPDHAGVRLIENRTGGNGGTNAGVSAWDLHDENPNCDHDTWLDNTYDTATPVCTTARTAADTTAGNQ